MSLGVVLWVRQLPDLSSRWSAGAGACLLAKKALEDWAGQAAGDEVAFLSTEEAALWSSIHLLAGRAVERSIFAVFLVEVASGSGSGSGRRRLSRCNGWSGDSGQGVDRRCCGFMGSDLLISFFKILLKGLDLVLHCADQVLHLGVGLLLEDFLDPSGGCDDFFHGSMF